MDNELVVEIRNKLTPAKTALDLLSQGKKVPCEFIKKAEENLNEAVRLLGEGEAE